jgi:hypothetical protein
MTTDDLQLLREFRAKISAPSEETRRRIYAHATSGKNKRLSRFDPRPRGLRSVLATAATVAVVACAGLGIAAGFGAFEGTPAPTEIANGFTLLNRVAGTDVQNGFYRNMPQTDASKAHGVLEVKTANGPEDLWSAPADNGTQCYSIDFANDYPSTTTGVLSVNGCEQSPAPPSNLDFSDVWFHTHPDLMTAYGSVYVPAATVQLTLDDGSTVSVPVVEHLFIASLPRGTRVIKATAFDTAGNQVAAQTQAENIVLPS